jgi:hypothetical protein
MPHVNPTAPAESRSLPVDEHAHWVRRISRALAELRGADSIVTLETARPGGVPS